MGWYAYQMHRGPWLTSQETENFYGKLLVTSRRAIQGPTVVKNVLWLSTVVNFTVGPSCDVGRLKRVNDFAY